MLFFLYKHEKGVNPTISTRKNVMPYVIISVYCSCYPSAMQCGFMLKEVCSLHITLLKEIINPFYWYLSLWDNYSTERHYAPHFSAILQHRTCADNYEAYMSSYKVVFKKSSCNYFKVHSHVAFQDISIGWEHD